MEELLDYFENIPTSVRASILIGGIVLFWILEGIIPLFKFGYKKTRHAGLNIFFTLTTMIVGFGLAKVLLEASEFTTEHQFGLLYIIDMPLWLRVTIGVLLMDLIGAYFVHWSEHKIKWMWRFHLVHHSDRSIDVTSGLRHHPGETLFRIIFTILAVLIIGAPMGVIMLYQSLSVLFAHLTHANIQMPPKLDYLLSFIFVTPYMHKVHHHFEQPLTDTNYGNIFSIWDRIFGTYAKVEDMNEIKYGVDTHMDAAQHTSIKSLLSIPFKK